MSAIEPETYEVLLRRGQKRFVFVLTSVVVVLSFGVGIAIGLSRGNVHDAYARQQLLIGDPSFQALLPVSSMQLTAMGQGTRIGGMKAESATFTANDTPERLLKEQVRIWKEKGLWTNGMASAQRGVAFAINRNTKEKYQTVAFYCPPSVRSRLCGGTRMFGVTSYVEGNAVDTGDAARIPQCPQFRLAGVYSTTDLGRPSVTASGICPAGLEQTKQYYSDTLGTAGWEQRSELPSNLGETRSTVLLFQKENEELSLVLSGSPDGNETMSVGTLSIAPPEEL